MKIDKWIVATETIGILATILITVKVIFLQPMCFSLLDGYLTLLPLIMTKILEIKRLSMI